MDRERRTERPGPPQEEATAATEPHGEWRKDHWHRNRNTSAAAWAPEAVVNEPCLNPHRHQPWWQGSLGHAFEQAQPPDGYTTEWGTIHRPFPDEVVGG